MWVQFLQLKYNKLYTQEGWKKTPKKEIRRVGLGEHRPTGMFSKIISALSPVSVADQGYLK